LNLFSYEQAPHPNFERKDTQPFLSAYKFTLNISLKPSKISCEIGYNLFVEQTLERAQENEQAQHTGEDLSRGVRLAGFESIMENQPIHQHKTSNQDDVDQFFSIHKRYYNLLFDSNLAKNRSAVFCEIE
jgi:hypothetical protein